MDNEYYVRGLFYVLIYFTFPSPYLNVISDITKIITETALFQCTRKILRAHAYSVVSPNVSRFMTLKSWNELVKTHS
jgi:hypothetical protein